MKTLKYLFILSLFVFAFLACEKEDNPDNEMQYDHSLILSKGNGTQLVLTNPVDGKDLYVSVPSPAVVNVKSLKAGYMCINAVFVAKTYLRDYTMSIYTCDAKTGTDTKMITGDDLYVQDISVSPAGQKVAFTAKKTSGGEYFQLYTINEDGSGQAHISLDKEQVSGLDGKEYELLDIGSPAFSPDGSRIAVNAHVDNTYAIPNSIFYDGVMVMNSDGSNKELLFWKQGKGTGIEHICWSQDGNFLIFKMNDNDDSFHRRVTAVNIASKKVTDITTSLEINGDQVECISTSPNTNRIVINQHLGGGSNLFIAEFETHDDILTIKGSPVKLTDRDGSGYSYYTPCWQLWDEN